MSDGAYPDYMDIIEPTKHREGQTVVIDKGLLTEVLNQAGILSTDEYRGATLTFNGSLNVEMMNPDLGQYESNNIPFTSGKIEPEVSISMNTRYLLDALKMIKDNEVKWKVADEGPVYFNAIQEEPYGEKLKHEFDVLIMPMRT